MIIWTTLVLALILSVLFIIGMIKDWEIAEVLIWSMPWVWIALALFLISFTFPTYTKELTIGDKITYLKEYNESIDEQIMVIVESYKDHETDVFKREVNATLLVEMYPELKSNELVVRQMDIYIENQTQIKELEIDRINLKGSKKLWFMW